MIPKKIYLREAELGELGTSERMVSCDGQFNDLNVEYTNLSQILHNANEEPKHGEDIIAICGTIPIAGVFTKDKGIFRYYDCLMSEWHTSVHLETVDKWAYIKDILPKECDKLSRE